MTESILVFLATTALGALIAFIGKTVKDMRAEREATKSLLRTEMTKTYYKYRDVKRMPYYIKQAWYANYESYEALKGNSFIKDLKEEIDEWDVE